MVASHFLVLVSTVVERQASVPITQQLNILNALMIHNHLGGAGDENVRTGT